MINAKLGMTKLVLVHRVMMVIPLTKVLALLVVQDQDQDQDQVQALVQALALAPGQDRDRDRDLDHQQLVSIDKF